MGERWRKLRVGDCVRYVQMPGGNVPGYYLHKDTRRLFKRLIAKRTILRIKRIDEWRQPWTEIRFKNKAGRREHHSLAVVDADDDWELVSRRGRSK
jgi:hypothetical protein